MSKRTDANRGFVTAEQVAARAGVSRSAVSRTFTAGASVSPATRNKVERAALDLGYRVNRLAQGLINDRSNLVGVIGANLSTPHSALQLDMLSAALLRRGFQSLLLNATDSGRDVGLMIELILEFRVRAIVLLSGTPPAVLVEECLAKGIPIILINRPEVGASADVIVSDDLTGGRLAADRLLRAGCRRLAIIRSAAGTHSQLRREAAFRGRARESGLDPVSWTSGSTGYETGVEAARTLLNGQEIDGAFCVTDLLALGFMDGVRHVVGKAVPDDVCVIGFDDIPQASWLAYRLTTINQCLESQTEVVVEAIARASETRHEGILEVIPVRLVERATVRP